MIKQIFTFVDLILSTFLNYCEFFFFLMGYHVRSILSLTTNLKDPFSQEKHINFTDTYIMMCLKFKYL